MEVNEIQFYTDVKDTCTICTKRQVTKVYYKAPLPRL